VNKEAEASKKDYEDDVALDDNLEESSAANPADNNLTPQYDVILQVKAEKIPKIKTQIIDGQKCIIVPIDDDEQATVNGLDNWQPYKL